MAVSRAYRLGIDVGGTFTDFLLMDKASGDIRLLKVPSTTFPVEAVLQGIEQLRETYGLVPSEVSFLCHGTTVATNALLQQSGTVVGVLTTKGFRDVLLLRRLRLPKANDFFVKRPVSLVARRHIREVPERILANGEVYLPICREEVEREARALVEDGVEAVAICFLHSYHNPDHELAARRWVEDLYPDIYVCTSAEIWPQHREYERFLVSVINAYVGKEMRSYFRSLEKGIAGLGITCHVFSTKSNGGIMSARSAAERPVETLLSGPAAGVIGATYISRLMGEDHIIALDMGGTSVDLSIVQGELAYSTENTVGDFPVIIPALDVSSIGAGGGSIAWTDAEGVLKVGPQSAGADPGPACYGRGGHLPTITDAYVTVGLIAPGSFLGGNMVLKPELATAAIDQIGRVLGLNMLETADSILQVASSNIYAELLPQMARRGVDPSQFSILVYGGAGPTHVFMLARDLRIRQVIVPTAPGTLCALGCLVSDMRADFVQTIWQDLSELHDEEIREIYSKLEQEALGWLVAEEADIVEVYLLRSADMCYTGQSFEINVPFPSGYDCVVPCAELEKLFHNRYKAIYGYADEAAPSRLVNARVQVVGVTHKPTFRPSTAPSRPTFVEPTGSRVIYEKGRSFTAGVYQRDYLQPGSLFRGPAIVEQYDTTIYIPQGFRASIDPWSNLIGEVDT